jgi:hypothetical protein
VKALSDGVHQIDLLQSDLISERLLAWKNSQKLTQIGVSFDNRDSLLDEIQTEYRIYIYIFFVETFYLDLN